MKATKKNFVLLVLALGAWLFCAKNDRIAGTVTDTGNPGVKGQLAYQDGTPAANASVILRPSSYLPDANLAKQHSALITMDSTRTDDGGHYEFRSIDSGFYAIEARDVFGKGAIAQNVVITNDRTLPPVVVNDTLRPLGGISGTIDLPDTIPLQNVRIQIYGTDRNVQPDSSGHFEISNLPEGNYDFHIVISDTSFDLPDSENVTVAPGQETKVDTLGIPTVLPKLLELTADPAGSPGFTRAYWVPSINKMVTLFGTNGTDNSVRAYDPVTNAWEYLWPNSNGANGLQNRSSHVSFYVPRLDEIWVWGGNYLENLPQGTALYGGRFSIAERKWVATSITDAGAFDGVVQNFAEGLPDAACAWSAEADMGLLFAGYETGNASNRYWIIEPNMAGPEPYRMYEDSAGFRPPARKSMCNGLVAVGPDFYLRAGGYQDSKTLAYRSTNDLWKFSSATKTWTQLPPPPPGSDIIGESALTYDSDRNRLVILSCNGLYAYDIATAQWSDHTITGSSGINNTTGVYTPTAKMLIYDGGSDCLDNIGTYRTFGVKW